MSYTKSREPLKTEVDQVVYRVYVDDVENYPIDKMMTHKLGYITSVGWSSDPEKKNSILVQTTEEGLSYDVHVWMEHFRVEYDNGTL